MFRYTYAVVRIIVIQIETGDRHRSRVMRTSRAQSQRYLLNPQEKKKYNKKVVTNTKPNTNQAALATQTGREESIHVRHRLIETGTQTRNGLVGDRGFYW